MGEQKRKEDIEKLKLELDIINKEIEEKQIKKNTIEEKLNICEDNNDESSIPVITMIIIIILSLYMVSHIL